LHIVTNLVANTLVFYTYLLNVARCYRIRRQYTSLLNILVELCTLLPT